MRPRKTKGEFFSHFVLELFVFINKCSCYSSLPIFPLLPLTSSKFNELHVLQIASWIFCASLCTCMCCVFSDTGRWVCPKRLSKSGPYLVYALAPLMPPRELDSQESEERVWFGEERRGALNVYFAVSVVNTRILVPN